MDGFPTRAMMVMTTRLKSLLLIGLCLGLTLGGCGRKAPLETPGASTPETDGALDPAVAAAAAKEAEAKPKQMFFLDPLIGANKPSEEITDSVQ
ncbi:MAG: hypothetical protein ABJL55_05565 [Roseibium sp.]